MECAYLLLILDNRWRWGWNRWLSIVLWTCLLVSFARTASGQSNRWRREETRYEVKQNEREERVHCACSHCAYSLIASTASMAVYKFLFLFLFDLTSCCRIVLCLAQSALNKELECIDRLSVQFAKMTRAVFL